MHTRDRLDSYLKQLETRLRVGAILRGGAILTSVALVATVALVFISNLLAFSAGSVTGARVALLLCLAFSIGFGLAVPLYLLDRRRAAHKAERVFPRFEQRLITFAERSGSDAQEPMLELMAAEALDMAAAAPAARVVSNGKLMASLGVGAVSLGVLVWMIAAAPGYMGHGASLLWTGSLRSATPLYDLRVNPGDVSVRRNGDQIVTAEITGLQPSSVRIYARSQSASKWEQFPMQAQPGASGYQYLFTGLPEGVEYYVEAGPLHSRHFNIKVLDVPSVKQIKVTYRYPSWTGQPNSVDEHGGDLRAVEGTDADLEITTDRPMKEGTLVLDDGRQVKLDTGLDSGAGNVYKGAVHMDKDGIYYVASQESGQQVRISYDFIIEAQKLSAPDVQIMHPAPDYHASSIEEVTVAVRANADFGLDDMALHYSVNGGPEKTVGLLKEKGAKSADGATTLYLEDYKMVPGDLIALYATARDARTESHTNLLFIQADSFEGGFSQAQPAVSASQADPTEVSAREKEIIAETWQQRVDQSGPKDQTAEAARFLASLQSKLREQVLSLASRMEARNLAGQNQGIKNFLRDLLAAAQSMDPAAQKLGQQKWNDAIPNEERALESLLRGETPFQQMEAASGSLGSDAGRELANLFNLEFNTEKNQAAGETASSSSPADQRGQNIADAVRKLDDLARRQQALANQQGTGPQTEQQRQQQDALRREAQQLQQQVQQFAQNQGGPQGPSGAAGSNASGQGSQGGGSQSNAAAASASGPQDSPGSPAQLAADRVQQALQSMERATAQPNANDARTDARNAADQLQDAANLLDELKPQSSQQLDALAKEASQLAEQARAQADQVRQLSAQDSGQGSADEKPAAANTQQQRQRLADDRARLAAQLDQLEKRVQQSQRGLAETQQPAAAKLLDALGELQQSDLINRLKKSAESLSKGTDPNSNISEAEITSSLDRLSDRVQQAERSINAQGTNPDNMAAVERIRNQMQTIIKSTEPNSKPPIFLSGDDANGEGLAGRSGQEDDDSQAGLTPGQGGIIMGPNGQRGDVGGAFTAGARDLRDQQPGVNPGNSGNGSPQGGTGTPQQGTDRGPAAMSQGDINRAIQQAEAELNALKQGVQGAQELADINALQDKIKRLEASHSPSDPAMVRQLEAEVLATVDRLELQLRRDIDNKQGSQVRSGDSLRVPPGYQESVAEYFRRLSKTEKQNPQ